MAEHSKTYSVKSNGFTFSFTEDEIVKSDIVQLADGSYNLIKDNRSVNAKVTAGNGKKLQVEIDGETFDIEIRDELDQVLDQMGFNRATVKQVKEIKAPMPGLVLEISVKEGQEVKEGDKLLILEAMKMENSIIIHTNAVIKQVSVSPGQAVEKGQVLIELQ